MRPASAGILSSFNVFPEAHVKTAPALVWRGVIQTVAFVLFLLVFTVVVLVIAIQPTVNTKSFACPLDAVTGRPRCRLADVQQIMPPTALSFPTCPCSQPSVPFAAFSNLNLLTDPWCPDPSRYCSFGVVL